MKQEILDFYANNNLPVGRMVHVGVIRRGLTADAVRKAAEVVYQEIHDGTLKIEPIRIAWEVYSRAKHLRGDENTEVEVLKKEISRLKMELNMPWHQKLMRRFKGNDKVG